MISKELLTGMRKDEYTILDIDYDSEDSKIGYLLSNNQWYFINIHELAHKCKQWAYDNFKYRLISGRSIGSDDKYVYFCTIYLTNSEHYGIAAKTEPEVIFQACEWILKQKENNE